MRDIKGVFFDLHGTLLLSNDLSKAWADWLTAFHACLMDAGLAISKNEFTPYLENFFERLEPESYDDELSVFERRIKDLSNKLGLELCHGDIHQIASKIIRVWHQDMFLDPEAHLVLQTLKPKFVLGLITNWEHPPRISSILSELNISRYFDDVVISADVGVAKPDPEIFRIALNNTGLQPSEVTYIGDAKVDVEGSLSAGIRPVFIQRWTTKGNWDHENSTRSKPSDNKWISKVDGVIVISSLMELLDMF